MISAQGELVSLFAVRVFAQALTSRETFPETTDNAFA